MPGLDKRGVEYLMWMAQGEERERSREARAQRDATRRRVLSVTRGKAFLRGR